MPYVKPAIPNMVKARSGEAPLAIISQVKGNSAQHSHKATVPLIGPPLKSPFLIGGKIVDHTIGGEGDSIFDTDDPAGFQDMENGETDFESSGFDISKSSLSEVLKTQSLRRKSRHKHFNQKFDETLFYKTLYKNIPNLKNSSTEVTVGTFIRPPIAIDDRHKRPWRPMNNKGPGRQQLQSNKHSKHSNSVNHSRVSRQHGRTQL